MTRKKTALPAHADAVITGLTHDGRGIAQINGKKIFIENALPGEHVTFSYTKQHSNYAEGRAESHQTVAAERTTPRCQHFTICGGCALQHMSHALQLQLKQTMLLEQLQHFGKIQPQTVLPPLTGQQWGYRHKARLGVKYVAKKNKVLVGFREKNGRYLADIQQCEVLAPQVGLLITQLQALITQLDAFETIPQIEVAIGDDSTALIFRHMQALAAADTARLIEFAQAHTLEIYLQPGGNETVHLLYPSAQAPRLYYALPAQALTFAFHPTDFTQINPVINQQMVTRALALLELRVDDNVLDLFCGLGNFTLPIAQRVAQVVGIEGAATMVERATENALKNNITNAEFYAADLSATLQKAAWAQRRYTKILLDPPRTGALEIIKQLAHLQAQRIVYISCNPATLARDAGELVAQGYQLLQAGIMDMFPHTHHVEAIAVFVK